MFVMLQNYNLFLIQKYKWGGKYYEVMDKKRIWDIMKLQELKRGLSVLYFRLDLVCDNVLDICQKLDIIINSKAT